DDLLGLRHTPVVDDEIVRLRVAPLGGINRERLPAVLADLLIGELLEFLLDQRHLAGRRGVIRAGGGRAERLARLQTKRRGRGARGGGRAAGGEQERARCPAGGSELRAGGGAEEKRAAAKEPPRNLCRHKV